MKLMASMTTTDLMPNPARRTPPLIGPTRRVSPIESESSEFARTRASWGTSAGNSACRAGKKSWPMADWTALTAMRIHSVERVSTKSSGSRRTERLTSQKIIVRRRSNRSTSVPPRSPSRSLGTA